MNEITFISQVGFILLFTYGAMRLGKSALVCSITLQAILANLFVLKQMTFFGLEVTCSDAFAIGSILGLNLLREYYGAEAAKRATWICFFFFAFFVVLSQLHLRFVPSPHDTAHVAYSRILSPAPRLLIASLVTFFLVQRLDLKLFGWISGLLPRSRFPTRSSLSLCVSQAVDTVLFSFLGLYGMVANIGHILLVSFLVKAIILLVLSPLMALLDKFGARAHDPF